MDPNATLDELESLFAKGRWSAEDIGRIIELWWALDRWMSTGGFPPAKWGRPPER